MFKEYTIIAKRSPFGIVTEAYCNGNFVGCVGEKLLMSSEISGYCGKISNINKELLSNKEDINDLETIVRLQNDQDK